MAMLPWISLPRKDDIDDAIIDAVREFLLALRLMRL